MDKVSPEREGKDLLEKVKYSLQVRKERAEKSQKLYDSFKVRKELYDPEGKYDYGTGSN